MQGRGRTSTRIPQPTFASLRRSTRRDPTHQAFVDATYQENINNPIHSRQRRRPTMSTSSTPAVPTEEGIKGKQPEAQKNLKSQECRLKSKGSFHKKSLQELETKWLGSNQSDLSLDEQVWLNRWISESLDQESLRKE